MRLFPRRPNFSFRMVPEGAKSLLGALFDLALPPTCLLCRVPIVSAASFLCSPCCGRFPFREAALCPGCGEGAVAGPLRFCPACRERSFRRDGLLALADFREGARELIHAFKYRGDLGAGRFLSDRLGRKVSREADGRWDAVVPVPLHRSRLRARGFNQAVILGRGISRMTGLPLRPAALVRRVDTSPLAGLSRRRRFSELRGSISVRSGEPLEGMRLILVDDVVTSGATVEECARRLKEAGAAAVLVAAAGRTAGQEQPAH